MCTMYWHSTANAFVVGANPGDSDTREIVKLTQTNREVPAVGDWTINISGIFSLYSNQARTLAIAPFPDTSITTIKFNETNNAFNPCPGGGATGPAGSTCDDFYEIVAAELDAIQFTLDGVPYEVTFAIDPLTTIFQDGVFWTEEQIEPPGIAMLAIDATITNLVPEPGTVTLLGLGLVGLVAAGYRKGKKEN